MKFENNPKKRGTLSGIGITISVMILLLSGIGIANTELFTNVSAQNTISEENSSSINSTNSMTKVQNFTNANVSVKLPLVK